MAPVAIAREDTALDAGAESHHFHNNSHMPKNTIGEHVVAIPAAAHSRVHISERAPVSLAEERAVFDVPNNNLNLRIQYIKRHCVNMGGSPAV